jgi:hypothetical protein
VSFVLRRVLTDEPVQKNRCNRDGCGCELRFQY